MCPKKKSRHRSANSSVLPLFWLDYSLPGFMRLAGPTYHYFDRFGIPLLMVEIPKENYLVYGGIVGRRFPVWRLATARLRELRHTRL
jgi:hypothetical protein